MDHYFEAVGGGHFYGVVDYFHLVARGIVGDGKVDDLWDLVHGCFGVFDYHTAVVLGDNCG